MLRILEEAQQHCRGQKHKKAPANEKRAKDTSVTEQMVYKEKTNKQKKVGGDVVQSKTTKKRKKINKLRSSRCK